MAYSSKDCAEELGAGDAFICTGCGEGFSHYPKLVDHMASHGLYPPQELSSSNGNSAAATIEVVLHENGTLTVVDRSVLSEFSFLFGKPMPKLSRCQTHNQDTLTTSKKAEKDYTLCRCERCGQEFRDQKSLQQHQQYYPLGKGFKCTLCCTLFNDRVSLQSHLQNHAHERFYSCGHCGKRFLNRDTLLSHQKELHGSLDSKALHKLQEDQKNSMGKPYPCKICGLSFFWLSDLQSHLNSHSDINGPISNNTKEQKMLGEEDCNKNAPCIESKSPDLSYRCGLCGGHFIRLSELKDHHRSQHPGVNDEEDCSDSPVKKKRQSFGYRGKMRQRVAKLQMQRVDSRQRMRGRPRGAKRYSCKECHRVFVHSSSLSRHMRYHKGTLHVCVYCGRHFPQKCNVTKHIAIHHCSELQRDANKASEMESSKRMSAESSERPKEEQEDQDLEEETQQSSNVTDNELSLDAQKMSPTKPWKHRCSECGETFQQISVYLRHVRVHRLNPTKVLFYCPVCPSRFVFRTALDRHLKNHNKDDFKKSGIEPLPPAESEVIDSKNEHEDEDVDAEPDSNADNSMSSEVLYECTECTQTFSDLEMFQQHKNSHAAE